MLPLSSILPLFWPGQVWGTENDDAKGQGVIAYWAKDNTLPEPTVEQVRAREAEAVAILAEREAKQAKADAIAEPDHLIALSEAVHAALAELKAALTPETREKIEAMTAKKPLEATASVRS